MGATDMEVTLVTENSKVRYVGDGARVEFAYDFNPIDLNYVKVYKNLVEVNSPDITVSPGVVTFEVAPLAGDTIVIMRDMPLTYAKGIVSKGIINSDSLDNLAVELLGQIQQVNEKLSRTPTYPLDTSLTGEEIFSEFNQNVQSVKDAKDIVNGKVEEVNSAVSSGLNEITEATSESQTAITEGKNNAISEIQTATAGLIQRAETAADEAEASRTNAEEWAKSVDAENIVHRTGNEDINDIKTFNSNVISLGGTFGYIAQNNNIVAGTNPSTNLYCGYDFRGKGGTRLAYLGVYYSSSGGHQLQFQRLDTNIQALNLQSFPATYVNTPSTGANSYEAVNASWANTKLNAKQNTITGAATTITSNNLTTGRALISDGSGKVAVANVTSTELGYLDGVSSSVQNQLNTKANLASPAFSGTPTVPTPAVSTNNTQAINTQWFNQKIQVVSALPSSPNANVYYFVTG